MPLFVLRVPFSTLLPWHKGTWTHAACAYLATHPANIVFRWMRIDLRAYVEGEGVLAFTCWHVKRLWEQIQILTWLYYGVRVSSLRSLGNWTLRSPFQLITRHATSCYQWQIYAGHSRGTQHICKYAWIVTSLCGNLDLAMTWHLRDQTPLPFLCLQIYELTWPKYSQTLTHS